MKKVGQRGSVRAVPASTLAEQGAEALRLGRFKEAVEAFKQLIRQEGPRPEWQCSLAEAYCGRARAMAAKGMFKEAAIILENTTAPDGTIRDPLLYLGCLIREGQQQKAAAHSLKYIGRGRPESAEEEARLEDLTAALSLAGPVRHDVPSAGQAELSRWTELTAASQQALAAWIDGAPGEEIDRHLNRISLRSPFKPVRLILKSLITAGQDPDRSRRLLEGIPADSAFAAFRQAVEATLPGEQRLGLAEWNSLTPVQRSFVAETRGVPAATSLLLAQLSEAERNGPAALFSFLLKQSALPVAEVRSACLNLLPQIPDRLSQFERSFGPLTELEKNRLLALAAEARTDWGKAERYWRAAAASLVADQGRQARLSQGVIYRHLARLAEAHPEFEGEGDFGCPTVSYLERSLDADPDYLPAVLQLIALYREENQTKDWHRLAEEAVRRFPDESAVLLQAVDSAVARKAYKKAAGFARKLLKLDPINTRVRRNMIELQVAHARKQMRAKRPDLASKDLAQAAEWERPDAPSSLLRIAQGLIGLQLGQVAEAEARLRDGVQLAGGGVAGWFVAALEAEFMKAAKSSTGLLRQELARMRDLPPTKEGIMSIGRALAQPEVSENKRAVSGVFLRIHSWLLQGGAIDWSPAEFHAVAEAFHRVDAFELLREYARHALQRDPGDPIGRFYRLVARTKGDPGRLSFSEAEELADLADAASEREDFHTANRIRRFLDAPDLAPAHGKGEPQAFLPGAADFMELAGLIGAMIEEMPEASAKSVRGLIAEHGREAAIAALIERFRESPLGQLMPEPVIREFCEIVVTNAIDGSRKPRR